MTMVISTAVSPRCSAMPISRCFSTTGRARPWTKPPTARSVATRPKATEWNTPEQLEYKRKAGLAYLQKVVHGALREDSQRLTDQGADSSRSPCPIAPALRLSSCLSTAADCLRQHFACESCGCRYSSLGAAFFCPACGHNSAKTTFAKAVHTVRALFPPSTPLRPL